MAICARHVNMLSQQHAKMLPVIAPKPYECAGLSCMTVVYDCIGKAVPCMVPGQQA